MPISTMALELPPDIGASVSRINEGADTLDEICSTMYGRVEDLDSQFNCAANQFTDLIAWDISSASAEELRSWQKAGGALTNGAAVLRLWAEDIEAYREVRDDLYERWETAKSISQSRVDHPIASITSTGVTGGLGMGIYDAATTSREQRETQEICTLDGLRCTLRTEHDTAWETLMDQADQTKKDLRNGPSAKTLDRLVDAGHLDWNRIGYFSTGNVPVEDITENADPGAINAWWNFLSEAEQDAAMDENPELLRDLNGIPAAVRDELNREHLDDEIERFEEEIEHLEEEIDEFENERDGGALTPEGEYLGNSADLAAAQQALSALEELRESLNSNDSDQYLLALYPSGPGQAIVSEGNPDTADNVATIVPGMTNSWKDVLDTMERGGNLSDHTSNQDPDSETAVISWHGYTTPLNWQDQGLSLEEFDYREAGESLAAFQEGLRASHEGDEPSHNSVFGHSWGTMVVGHGDSSTGEDGLHADSITFVGGPGAGVESAAEFSTPEENVHVILAEDDVIEVVDTGRVLFDWVGDTFGTSFYDDKFFTADPDSPDGIKGNYHDSQHVHDGETEEERHNHSGYFYEETVLDYMGRVASGK